MLLGLLLPTREAYPEPLTRNGTAEREDFHLATTEDNILAVDTARTRTRDAAARAIETWRHEHGLTPTEGPNLDNATSLGRAMSASAQGAADQLRLVDAQEAVSVHAGVEPGELARVRRR